MCEKGQGPIANLLLVGLNNIKKGVDGVEKAIDSRANVEMSSLEKNMTWIALCIATAPMLGFLGTVWGMVSAFDAIAAADNISAKIVAEGISSAFNNSIWIGSSCNTSSITKYSSLHYRQ